MRLKDRSQKSKESFLKQYPLEVVNFVVEEYKKGTRIWDIAHESANRNYQTHTGRHIDTGEVSAIAICSGCEPRLNRKTLAELKSEDRVKRAYNKKVAQQPLPLFSISDARAPVSKSPADEHLLTIAGVMQLQTLNAEAKVKLIKSVLNQ